MKITDNNEPAFPVWELNGRGVPEMTCFGMSLRDHFAGEALSGLLSGALQSGLGGTMDARVIGKAAYALADGMLYARSQDGGEEE